MPDWINWSLLPIFLSLLSAGLSCLAAAKTLPIPKLDADPVASLAGILVDLADKHQKLTRMLINKVEREKNLGKELSTEEYAALLNAEQVRSGQPQASQDAKDKTLVSLLNEINQRSTAQGLLQLSAAAAILAAVAQVIQAHCS